MVLSASGATSPGSEESLESLCRQYWPPLYAYVRHLGRTPHDAQDLTQAFFAKLLEKDWLRTVEPSRGKFRSFLLMALKRFLSNERDRVLSLKRGGAVNFISLDADAAEQMLGAVSEASSAEMMFDRRWALTLLDAVMRRLRSESENAGRLREHELLKPCLVEDRGHIDYEELARGLNVEPASARSSVHRLRKRFREVFREEVAATVADPKDVDGEMRALVAALAVE